MRINSILPVLTLTTFLSACGGSGVEDSTGVSEPSAPSTPTAPSLSSVEKALITGDVSPVTDSTLLLDEALETIELNRDLLVDSVEQILNLSPEGEPRVDGSSLVSIDWNPTHYAALLGSTFGLNAPILRTNSVTDNSYDLQDQVIGVAGLTPSRHLFLGGNPMRNFRRDSTSLNEDMHQFLSNSIAWLQHKDSGFSEDFTVVISQMANSYYFPDEPAVREWLDEYFPEQVTYNVEDTCDDAALASCLQASPDLLIISQLAGDNTDTSVVVSAVSQAMEQGVPVLYLHYDGLITPLGSALMSLMDVSYEGDNYWRRLDLKNYDASEISGVLPSEISAVKRTLTHFKNEDYFFDWSLCEGEDCDAVIGLDSEFFEAADHLRENFVSHDTNKNDLFSNSNHKLQKLLVLLGDHYRQSIDYPMDKVQTVDTTFMKALFADHTVHHYRQMNFAPPALDLGNFSRNDFSNITPTSKAVSVQSKEYFRAAGVYALPGQTFSVTRNDNSDLNVTISVNTQRSGSTHQWASEGYSRPKYLKSPAIEIAPAETISLTSPYGGPIQIGFDQNDLEVNLNFDNIGLHPYWQSSTDDETFAAQIAAAEFDWAEISTPGFEVHSTLEKMQESMIDPALDLNTSAAQAISAATMRYVHNFPHVLAGFKGPGIDVVAEIHDFAAEHNLSVDNLDLVKHMNADQATCGYGCSGNPYDAYWAFSPVGHGDIHELGHGLEKFRLRFNDWELHTMTNMYSYYTKSQFYQDTGKEPGCQSLPFESTYRVLADSFATADPAAYVKASLWDPMGWSEGAGLFIQLMMSAEDNSELDSGWHLLSRLHLLEREFSRATSTDDARWEAQRSNFGMDQYSLADAIALDQNDWLLITISLATDRDHRAYFDVWALDYSAEASAQVQSKAYSDMPTNFYVSSGSGYCKGEGFDGQKLPLNGSNLSWPLTD